VSLSAGERGYAVNSCLMAPMLPTDALDSTITSASPAGTSAGAFPPSRRRPRKRRGPPSGHPALRR
jgi:hypothetical protein